MERRTDERFVVDSRTGNPHPQAEPPLEEVDSAVPKDRYPRRSIPCCAGITTGTQNKTDQENFRSGSKGVGQPNLRFGEEFGTKSFVKARDIRITLHCGTSIL
ncbi:hypothetical protein H2248_006655 [Termitomyces sp. 'cryptogamus']|nr:hypothetical protein H2248_006655 [Termitomyces sp. 'cryptogamus']